jgi:hypothetical protein
VQDDPPQLVLHLPDRGLGGGHDRLDHQAGLVRVEPAVQDEAVSLRAHVQGGGARLHATADEATDRCALKREVLADGAGPDAGGCGADAIHADAAGGQPYGTLAHGRECSRPPRLG